jgi:hypothetical protein
VNEKYDSDCWDSIGISADDLMQHYFDRGQNDPLIEEYAAGEVRQYKRTRYYYLIVECGGIPGLRLAGIWHAEDDGL